MFQPYKIIEKGKDYTTYQYSSLYSWILLLILFVGIVGFAIHNSVIEAAGAVLIVCYFIAKLVLGRDATRVIRRALKSGSVELSGNKYSFSNPLTVKVPMNA